MKNLILKITAVILFVGVLVVNYSANAIPIGGVTTGEAADALPNLFTPIGFTFSIWGLIYALLAVYTIYQFWPVKKHKKQREELLTKVNTWFIVTSVANIAWIFAWHNQVIWLSLLIMLVILGGLIMLADILREAKLSGAEWFAIRLPFSIYFGWITVATIANVAVLLVSLGWDGFSLSEAFWTMLILLIGASIGIWRMYKDTSVPYGLVFIWAYAGILYKHLSPENFDGQYTGVIRMLAVCLVVLTLSVGYVKMNGNKKYDRK